MDRVSSTDPMVLGKPWKGSLSCSAIMCCQPYLGTLYPPAGDEDDFKFEGFRSPDE